MVETRNCLKTSFSETLMGHRPTDTMWKNCLEILRYCGKIFDKYLVASFTIGTNWVTNIWNIYLMDMAIKVSIRLPCNKDVVTVFSFYYSSINEAKNFLNILVYRPPYSWQHFSEILFPFLRNPQDFPRSYSKR